MLDSDRISRSEGDGAAFSQSSPGIASAPAMPATPVTTAEVPKVSLAAASAFGSYPPPAESAQLTQIDEPPAAVDPPARSVPEPIAVEAAQPPHVDAATPPAQASEPPRSKPAPVEPAASANASVLDEPIRTRSMARLLATQGHAKRALAIYDFLLVKTPNDAALRADAEALRSQLSA